MAAFDSFLPGANKPRVQIHPLFLIEKGRLVRASRMVFLQQNKQTKTFCRYQETWYQTSFLLRPAPAILQTEKGRQTVFEGDIIEAEAPSDRQPYVLTVCYQEALGRFAAVSEEISIPLTASTMVLRKIDNLFAQSTIPDRAAWIARFILPDETQFQPARPLSPDNPLVESLDRLAGLRPACANKQEANKRQPQPPAESPKTTPPPAQKEQAAETDFLALLVSQNTHSLTSAALTLIDLKTGEAQEIIPQPDRLNVVLQTLLTTLFNALPHPCSLRLLIEDRDYRQIFEDFVSQGEKGLQQGAFKTFRQSLIPLVRDLSIMLSDKTEIPLLYQDCRQRLPKPPGRSTATKSSANIQRQKIESSRGNHSISSADHSVLPAQKGTDHEPTKT